MAAHVVTALNEIKERDIPWSHLQAALDFSCWTEDLEDHDYLELQKIVTAEDRVALKDWNDRVYPFYANQLEQYGNPANREGWLKVKYNL